LYTFFDAHCDTIQKLCDTGQDLFENNCHLSLKDMEKNRHIQIFAAFIDKKTDMRLPFERANQLIDYYYLQLEKYSEHILHCNTLEEIQSAVNDKKTAALLSIEGGEALNGRIENLDYFYKRGVRLITLTWNYENELCGSIGEGRGSGLTEFGKDVVKEMNRTGMVIDVSHISLKGFWDVLETTKKPIVASHSNVFELKSHKRNLNREQIEAIIKNNGCIGINFYNEFLSNGKCKISDIIKHIEYILSLGGENNIGLGSDFDGMDLLPERITGVADIEKLPEELLKMGYSEKLVKKIIYENFLRVLNYVI